MNRFIWPLIVFLGLAVILGVALQRAPEKMTVASALIGKSAPAFALPDLFDTSRQVKSSDFQGRWYLLNVWGTWCVECRVEHPVLLDLQRQGKVSIVGLNYKDDSLAAQQWLSELGNPYAAVAVDQEGRTAIDWGVYGAPETFLVNPQGMIVEKIVGVVTQQNWTEKLLPHIEKVMP